MDPFQPSFQKNSGHVGVLETCHSLELHRKAFIVEVFKKISLLSPSFTKKSVAEKLSELRNSTRHLGKARHADLNNNMIFEAYTGVYLLDFSESVAFLDLFSYSKTVSGAVLGPQ